MENRQLYSSPSGMMLALSVPRIPTRRIFASGGDRGWLATSDSFAAPPSSQPLSALMDQSGLAVVATAAFANDEKMFGPAVQSGFPLALSTTSTCEES